MYKGGEFIHIYIYHIMMYKRIKSDCILIIYNLPVCNHSQFKDLLLTFGHIACSLLYKVQNYRTRVSIVF